MRRAAEATCVALTFFSLFLACGCGEGAEEDHTPTLPPKPTEVDESHPLFDHLPPGFPPPYLPPGSVTTREAIELGRHLFYDTRLSRNETQSCASCHKQELAFTDGLPVSLGSTGQKTPKNSMGLANVAYAASLTWAHPLLGTLERQALIPMFGDDPVELGLRTEEEIVERLGAVERYQELFRAAFPEDEAPITLEHVTAALAAFQRTLLSGNSPFDRWIFQGEKDALSAEAKRGYALLNGHPFECSHCHVDFNLTDAVYYEGKPSWDTLFHNNGLYDLDGQGAYPEKNRGVMDITGKPADMGRFRAPSLRNVAVTAPYMHDGSLATLDDVLDHYARGGTRSPLQSPLLQGFELSDEDRAAMHAFFESLTDEEFLKNPAFSSPWPQ